MSSEELRRQLRDLDGQRRGLEEEITMLSERLNAPGQPGLKGSLLDKEGFPRADIDVTQVRRDRHRLICLTNDHKALSDKLAGLLAQLHAAARAENGGSSANGNGGGAASQAAVGPSGSAPAAAAAAPTAAAAATANGATVRGDGGGAAPMEVDADRPASGGGAAAADTAERAAADGGGSGGEAAASGPVLVPFALIDEVSEGSPAASAGLQVGDLLCAFGDVTSASASGDQATSQPGPAGSAGGSGGGGGGGGAAAGVLQRVAGVLGGSEGRPVATTVLRRGAPLSLTLVPQRWAGRGLLGCHMQPL